MGLRITAEILRSLQTHGVAARPKTAGTMNLVTTLVNTMEALLRPENLSNKADQVGWGARFPPVKVPKPCPAAIETVNGYPNAAAEPRKP